MVAAGGWHCPVLMCSCRPSALDSTLASQAPSLPAAAGGISADPDADAALSSELSETGT